MVGFKHRQSFFCTYSYLRFRAAYVRQLYEQKRRTQNKTLRASCAFKDTLKILSFHSAHLIFWLYSAFDETKVEGGLMHRSWRSFRMAENVFVSISGPRFSKRLLWRMFGHRPALRFRHGESEGCYMPRLCRKAKFTNICRLSPTPLAPDADHISFIFPRYATMGVHCLVCSGKQ